MASNILSRLLPPGSPSIYETMREYDEASDSTDIEERAGLALDEENLGSHNFQLDPETANAMEDRIGIEHSPKKVKEDNAKRRDNTTQPGQAQGAPKLREAREVDDEVPLSLLIETHQARVPITRASPVARPHQSPKPTPVPGPAAARERWKTTQEQQKLYQDTETSPDIPKTPRRKNFLIVDPKEKAMWRWANVQNLDNFLFDVYHYFLENGIWSILLKKALGQLTFAFVVSFSVFLSSCIDFSQVKHAQRMEDIYVKQCMSKTSGFWSAFIWICAFGWIVHLFLNLYDIRRLKHMHDFYHYLLEIPDTDIQTISWQDVVKRLMALRNSNPTTAAGVSERHRRFIGTQSKQRMDAHDIANRLMRRDNYLIALFNKDILDLTLPVPFLRNRTLFSSTLEWNLNFCILEFMFTEQGQVRSMFLKDSHRKQLSDGLRRRFIIAGLFNILCAPFILIYFMVTYFFRYFNEYQKNPSSIGSRQYTPYAEWKFREFNELRHLFDRRINMSYPFASRYLDQFPKDKTIQLAKFISFVAGALAAVLAVTTLIDPDLFLGFEVTPDRTVLFYLGVLTTIWAITRGTIPEENLVFDPEFALSAVVNYTHYLPSQWLGRLHSDEVRKEFAQLYQLKVLLFFEEVINIITTPFILWFSLPKNSERIVDFIREFTVHVDGLGYVCSFAVFDFEKGGNSKKNQRTEPGADALDLRDDYYSTKDGKMLASYYNFVDNYVTNPKQGNTFHHPSSRAFHPPPVFPGLTSSQQAAEGMPTGRHESWDRHQRGSGRYGISASQQRTPRFAPIGGQGSPMTSILLDPQHQPATGVHKPSHRPNLQSRLRNSRRPITDLIEDNEDELADQAGPSSTEVYSQLGESWKTTKAGTLEEDEETGGVRTSAGENSPGVLGLVYQFSKAQAEGRGGVHI